MKEYYVLHLPLLIIQHDSSLLAKIKDFFSTLKKKAYWLFTKKKGLKKSFFFAFFESILWGGGSWSIQANQALFFFFQPYDKAEVGFEPTTYGLWFHRSNLWTTLPVIFQKDR